MRIDTTTIPSYFSQFPVRIHKNATLVEEATRDCIDQCTLPGSEERKKSEGRHDNSRGNLYAICWPETKFERIRFAVIIIEILWIHDDVIEEFPHSEAINEHNILRQALRPDFDHDDNTGKSIGVKKQFLREVRDEILALDPVMSPGLIRTVDAYIQNYDASGKEFERIEEYIPYRIVNAGFHLMRHLTYWAMNIDLTREELETIQEFEELVGVSIALSNDYYSWNMEKLQKTDRVRNAVPLLMKQYSLPEHAAKDLLKGMIVDTEQRAKEAKMQLFEDESLTENLKRYIHGWELYAGGISYWSATCMRYGKPQ